MHHKTAFFFFARIFLALLSNSFIKFETKEIVFWKDVYLFLLKSMAPMGFKFRLRPTICWSVFAYSYNSELLTGVISSWDEKDAEESRERLCSD